MSTIHTDSCVVWTTPSQCASQQYPGGGIGTAVTIHGNGTLPYTGPFVEPSALSACLGFVIVFALLYAGVWLRHRGEWDQ